MNRIKVGDIIKFMGHDIIRVEGDVRETMYVDNIAAADDVNDTTLDWVGIRKVNKQDIVENSKSTIIIVDDSVAYTKKMQEQGKVLLVVNNPKKSIAQIYAGFFLEKRKGYIHPSAIVDNDAVIHPTAYIGPHCVIGKSVIGANSVLNAGTIVYDNVKIGDNCIIQAGAVIGTDGLGCERDTDGTLIKFPHIKGVVIGNDVEIGANCQIARGALKDTQIGDGCKINGLCFIAHNCILGKNVWITGQSMIAGSCVIDDNVTIYSRVIIREQVHVGRNAVIGMGSVVTKHVPENELWLGCPAKKINK